MTAYKNKNYDRIIKPLWMYVSLETEAAYALMMEHADAKHDNAFKLFEHCIEIE